jgi:hypothetical protein
MKLTVLINQATGPYETETVMREWSGNITDLHAAAGDELNVTFETVRMVKAEHRTGDGWGKWPQSNLGSASREVNKVFAKLDGQVIRNASPNVTIQRQDISAHRVHFVRSLETLLARPGSRVYMGVDEEHVALLAVEGTHEEVTEMRKWMAAK